MCTKAVMHPEFHKWGSVGPWLSKNGAHVTKCGFDDFHQLPFVKSGINQTLNMRAFGYR